MGLQLTEDELNQFVTQVTTTTHKTSFKQDLLTSLIEFFNFFMDETQKPIPPYFSLERVLPPNKSLYQFNYGYQKLFKYQEKIQQITDESNNQTIQKISHLVLIFSKPTNLTCSVDKLKKVISYETQEILQIRSLETKIHRLEAFLKKIAYAPRRAKISISQLQDALHNATKQVDTSTEFSSNAYFENIFASFVFSINTSIYDLHALSLVPEDKNSPKPLLNITKFNSFIEEQAMEYSPSNEEELFVLKCASMRLVFDRLYTFHPRFLQHTESSPFFTKCKELAKLTTMDIGITPRLLQKHHLKMKVEELLDSSKELQLAIDELWLVQFYTNPIDIVDRIFKGIKKIELFVSKNNSKCGSMSFDDFFGLFVPVLVSKPPPNTIAVATFLSCLDGLKLSSPFQFAMLLFTTAVRYISETSIKEIIQQAKG